MIRYWESHDERLVEAEAELTYSLRDEISCALNWVRTEGQNHSTTFIRDMRLFLRKPCYLPSHVSILTPRQELAILGHYRKATRTGDDWTSGGTIEERLRKLQAQQATIAKTNAKYRN